MCRSGFQVSTSLFFTRVALCYWGYHLGYDGYEPKQVSRHMTREIIEFFKP